MKTEKAKQKCWCGSDELSSFGPGYSLCNTCGTLVSHRGISDEQRTIDNDDTAFYGKNYWLTHQKRDLGLPDIHTRARSDLTERNLHWLKALFKYCLPPAGVLELGCSHGSFVALLRHAGYDASGVEVSPWVVEFGQKTFDVPIFVGPVETLEILPGSLDVIVLMDLLEHLPDPVETMSHCLQLLKSDGTLLLQTPQFKEGMNYTALAENKARFLEMLIPEEHVYLFSDRSVTRLFQQIGAEHIQFETAVFGHYDMFFAVSRTPLAANSTEEIEAALTATSKGRLILALLDIYARETADKAHLIAQLQASEDDRAARLEVIEAQGKELVQIRQLEAERDDLIAQLKASEADRAVRLEMIQAQSKQLSRLRANWLIKIVIKTGLVSTKCQ